VAAPLIITLLWIIDQILWLYLIVVIGAVVISWLVAFGVLNTYNQLARTMVRFFAAATEPVFRRIRRVIPPIGGMDLSPVVVLLVIQGLRILIANYEAYILARVS
jgi:YggT family protein